MNIAKKFVDALKSKKQPSAYDTPAVVNRIEGSTAWVRIAGGIDETPVQKTIDAKAGDAVNVRISGGQAWITGNGTAPPTDDQVAIGVSHNLTTVTKRLSSRITSGEKEIKETKKIAEDAQTSADGKNTIFYSQTQPSSGMKVNDTWFNPNEGNAIYRYNGTAWVKEELGDDAIESISADKITAGTIDASQITVSNLDAGNITSGRLSTDHIAAGSFTITGGSINVETDSDDDSIIALNFDYPGGDLVSNMMQPGGDYLFYHDKNRREDTHFRTGQNVSLEVKDDSYVTYPTKRSIELSVVQYGVSEQKALISVNKHNTNGSINSQTVIEPGKITINGNQVPAGVQSEDHSGFTYNTGFAAYSTSDENAPSAHKFGRVVMLAGAYKATVAQSNTGVTIGRVPSGYEPITPVIFVQQGSMQNRFTLYIGTDGSIAVDRYGVSSNTPLPLNAWINIACTYISLA